jgi:response regulator NasT
MQQRSCSESDAYRAMQKMAMDRNRKMVEIAEDVLAVLQIVQTD